MSKTLLPGAWLGVIGGGQLGRMFTLEARRMGYRVCVLDPVAGCPAGQVADRQIVAPYDDVDAVVQLAETTAVITYEFENIDLTSLAAAEGIRSVLPGSHVLRVVQSRIREKQTLARHNVPVPPFAPVFSRDDLDSAIELVGLPCVLKTASFGYDGKGQAIINRRSDIDPTYEALSREAGSRTVPLICEAFVSFSKEISVICARDARGHMICYPPAENIHRNGILDVTIFPARITPAVERRSYQLAMHIADALDVVGLITVEMFLCPNGELLVNELAPRPHNSGHVTWEACPTSQFEQLLRIVCGLPLGDVSATCAAAMANLLGDLWVHAGTEPDFAQALLEPGVSLHLYGKKDARPGRKMGHLTAIATSAEDALSKVVKARERLTG